MPDVEDLNVLRRYPRATCEVAMPAFATGENSEVAFLVTEKTDGTYRPTDDSYFPRRARVASVYAAFSLLLRLSANGRNSGASHTTRSGWDCFILRR
jgi:hypothetical protein